MMKIPINDAPETDHGDGGHRRYGAAAWTDEQTAYALFLKTACSRLEVIAAEIGIEPSLVDHFVRDALVIVHHARHTRVRGRQAEAWINAIAHNLGRTRRYGATVPRRTVFWSLWPFARERRHSEGYAGAQRLTSAVAPSAAPM